MLERLQISRRSSDEEFDSSIFSDAEVVEYLDEMQYMTPCQTISKISKTWTENSPTFKQLTTPRHVPDNLIPNVNPEIPQPDSTQNLEEPSLLDIIDLPEFSDDEYSPPRHCVRKSPGELNQHEVVDLTNMSDDEFGSSVFGDDETLNCLDRSQIAFQNQQQSSFLRLPPEIRNNIYDYIFVSPRRIDPYYNAPWHKRNVHDWRKTSFSSCCRQVHLESEYVFWSRNSFYFYFISTLQHFMEDLTIEKRKLLRSIKYHYSRRGNPFRALRYLRSCTNLLNLEIAVKVSVADSECMDDAWYYPLLNAKDFILTPYSTVEFGPIQCYGEAVNAIPNQSEVDEAIENLGNALRKVKLEEQGRYNHHRYPDIFTDIPRNPKTTLKKDQGDVVYHSKRPTGIFGRWESDRISRA